MIMDAALKLGVFRTPRVHPYPCVHGVHGRMLPRLLDRLGSIIKVIIAISCSIRSCAETAAVSLHVVILHRTLKL